MTRTTGTLIGAAVLAAVVLGAVMVVAQSFVTPRWPTDLESFQYLVAINFGVPDLCDRIERRAEGGGSEDSPRGFQIESLRSMCFRELAHKLRQPELCDRVEPVRTLLRDGTGFGRAYCRDRVGGNGMLAIAVADPHNMEPFIGFMRQLGYGDREVVESKYQENPGNSPTLAPFDGIRRDPAFLSKLRAAPSFEEPPSPGAIRTAHPLEVLYQMVAVETPDPAWCARVSPNATLVDWSGGSTKLVRSRCYMAIAQNTLNDALCDRVPKAGSFPPGVQHYNSSEGCHANVAVYRRHAAARGNLRDGPVVFAQAPDFGEALQAIGYTNDAVTRVATPEPDEYWEFVSRLTFRGTPEARAEFVRRARSLR